MSIRSNALGYYVDLPPELQTILRKNGMQAHIVSQDGDLRLAVQGHDSPLLTYSISEQQLKALTDWGTTYANRNAYDTFASLVSSDFHMPKDFVHARNANGRVVMGLHGYRIGAGEYGRPMGRGPVLGWTPRMQDGFHMRRIGGALFMGGAPMVADRPDGRIKPGELQNGGYGFYYKGQQSVGQTSGKMAAQKYDVLDELKDITPQIQARPLTDSKAMPYNEQITSDVYFTKDKWQDVLSSHGILVDENSKTMTVQSMAINRDFVYDLTDDELKVLMEPSVKEASVQQRLDIINGIIAPDYQSGITMDSLNSKEQINLAVRPEVIEEIRGQEKTAYAVQASTNVNDDSVIEFISPSLNPVVVEGRDVAHVDGMAVYDEGKGWFREGQYGREVTVEDIKVEPVRQAEPDVQGNMKYRMTAVINGESITHEISQKQYDKFMAVDDYHRMMLFSKVFNEVDMKDLPRQHNGAHIGLGILAALTAAGELARGPMMHHPAPDLYMERHGGPVYFKPGVDSPQDIASRAFEAGINAAEHGVGLGR